AAVEALLDEVARDPEAEAGALAALLRREELVEDAVGDLGRNAAGPVADRDHDLVRARTRGDLDSPVGIGLLLVSGDRVLDEVQEHVRQAVRIADEIDLLEAVAEHQATAGAVQPVCEKPFDLVEHLGEDEATRLRL